MTVWSQKIKCFFTQYLEEFNAQVAVFLPCACLANLDFKTIAGGFGAPWVKSPTENDRIGMVYLDPPTCTSSHALYRKSGRVSIHYTV